MFIKEATDFGGILETSADDELFLVDLDSIPSNLNWVSTAGGIGDDEGAAVEC